MSYQNGGIGLFDSHNAGMCEDNCPYCGKTPRLVKSFAEWALEEDAAANSVGGGGIAGIGYPPGSKFGEPGIDLRKLRKQQGLAEEVKPDGEFAGAAVFEVDMDSLHKSRFGKNRYHRYSRYVGESEKGEQIRQFGRAHRGKDIVLKDATTAVMSYLRRKAPKL